MGKTIRSGADRSKQMAAQVRLLDAASLITAETLEGAIAEIAGDIVDVETPLGDSVANGVLTLVDKTPVNAVAAEAKLTSSGALVPASHATSKLTSDTTNNSDGSIVTIATTVYRFKNTLAQAYDVQIGASAAASLDNLMAAINASGTPGTEYFAGTLVHPTVVAFTNTDTTQIVTARLPGTTANVYPTTTDEAHLSWEDTTLGGGTGASTAGATIAAATVTIDAREYMFVVELSETAGAAAVVDQVLYGGSEAAALDNLLLAIDHGATEGTEYSTGTVVNATVEGGANTNTTQIVIALVKGVIGNDIDVATTCANTAWDAGKMGTEELGVDGTVGFKNEIVNDTGYIYICTADNTTADTNWKKVAIS